MKALLTFLVFLAISSDIQAAFISCTPSVADVLASGTPTSASFDCAPGSGSTPGSGDDNLAGDAFVITGIRLRVSGAFDDTTEIANVLYAVTFQTGNGIGITNPGCTALGIGDASNETLGSCLSTGVFSVVGGNPDLIPAFTVSVFAEPHGADLLPSHATASVFYEVQAILADVSVPEPSIYAILGIGLLGFNSIRRRGQRSLKSPPRIRDVPSADYATIFA